MRLTGTPDELNRVLRSRYPEAPEPPMNGAQMLHYQMLALYGLTRPFDCAAMSILEVGTGHGTSTYMLSKAAPAAQIVSLSLNKHEAAGAYRFLRLFQCGNVYVLVSRSDRYRLAYSDVLWDFVFVDGDHKHILGDMPWWNQVRPGGLILFHDYSVHTCPPVFETLNTWREKLGRPFDVEIVDSDGTGMAGWYKQEGEVWQE